MCSQFFGQYSYTNIYNLQINATGFMQNTKPKEVEYFKVSNNSCYSQNSTADSQSGVWNSTGFYQKAYQFMH